MDDIFKNIEEYNPKKPRKILIIFSDITADMLCDTKLNQIVTELSIRSRKLNISLVFTTRSYFAIQQSIRLNSTNYFVIQISIKREVQQIVFNHLLNIVFEYFMNLYKKCTATPYPPGIKTSWRRLSVSPSDVAGTSQMKHPTTSRWNVAKTSQWCLYDVLLERHNDVSKGRNNDALSLRLHDVSNKS